MSTRRDPWGSGAVEIATPKGIPPGSVGTRLPTNKTPGHEKTAFRRTWSSYGPPYPFGRWSSENMNENTRTDGELHPFTTPKIFLVKFQVFCPHIGSAVLTGLWVKAVFFTHLLEDISSSNNNNNNNITTTTTTTTTAAATTTC